MIYHVGKNQRNENLEVFLLPISTIMYFSYLIFQEKLEKTVLTDMFILLLLCL